MFIITRDQVKLYLGITVTDHDALIDAYIPIIDSKVKLITNHNFNDHYYGNLDSTKYLELLEYNGESLEAGQQLFGDNIDADTTIVNIFIGRDVFDISGTSYKTPFVELSKAVVATNSGQDLYFGISIAYLPTIAKGVWFLTGQQNTNAPAKSVKSKSIPPLSVTYSDADNKIDGVSGMPTWFVKALPKYMSGL